VFVAGGGVKVLPARLPKLLPPPTRASAKSTATTASPAAKAIAAAVKRGNDILIPPKGLPLQGATLPIWGASCPKSRQIG
jgi:hypothetical protein